MKFLPIYLKSSFIKEWMLCNSLCTGKIGSIYENRISNNKVGIGIGSEGGYIYHNQITDNKWGISAGNTWAKISFNNL